MFNNLIGKNKELGRFLFCERYTLSPVKNAMYIAEGQELKRGAVVDVNGVLVGTNSLMPYAVLEFDCDTRSGGKEASVFIKGEFNFDKLYFADGLDQSDLDNIVYNGSGIGIVIKPYEYAEGFIPLMVPAGTSKSNPLINADEAQRMIDASIHEVTLDPSEVALGNVHLLDEVTSFAADAKILVDSETNGPGAMPAENLLKETAQNALAGNVAQEFNPTRTSANPYKAGESVAYDGKTYIFKVDHYGAWSSADVEEMPINSISVPKGVIIEDIKTANLPTYVGIITGSNVWYAAGKHIAIPVKEGDIVNFVPRSLTSANCVYAFVTNAYTPSDQSAGSVPFAGEQSIRTAPVNVKKTDIAPANAAYLILETIDGGSNRYVFETQILASSSSVVRALGKNDYSKYSFLKNYSSLEFQSYSGIAGTSTIWINAGKHIAIPVEQGDVLKVTPSIKANGFFVTNDYTPSDHTSGQITFSSKNIQRMTFSQNVETTIVAGADSSYLILHVVDGGANKVYWTISKTLSSTESKEFVEEGSRTYKEKISLDNITSYAGGLSSTGVFFSGTNVAHKPLPVNAGERFVVKNPTNYGGSFAFVTNAYIPSDHTSGAVPFAGIETNRTVIAGNTEIELVAPANAAYLIFTIHDGTNYGCVYEVSKKIKTIPNNGVFQKLKYAHWNIGNFSMGKNNTTTISPADKATKQAAFREFINKIKPDVLGICEDNPTFSTDGTLATDAVYSCFEQQHKGIKSGYMMNSIYSNGLKVLQFSSQSFPVEFAAGYGYSEMLVELGGDLVILCESHLTWSDYSKRTQQIQYLIDRYANCKYVVIAADWNIGPNNGGPSEETEMAPIVSAGYRLSMMDYMPKESTYSGNDVTPASNSALDIICAKGFGIIGAEVRQDCSELSDHRLVCCDLIKNQ